VRPQNSDVPRAHSVSEVAKALGLSLPTAYRLCRQIGRRIGRRIVVSRTALEKWLEPPGGLASPGKRASPQRETMPRKETRRASDETPTAR